MKKVIIPGLVAGVVLLVINMCYSFLTGWIFPSITTEYQTALFRPWSDPLMWLIFIYPFLLTFVLAWTWNKVKSTIKAKDYKKGLNFGLAAFVVMSIPGMLITYSSFNVSLLIVLVWTVNGLISTIVSGLIFSKMN